MKMLLKVLCSVSIVCCSYGMETKKSNLPQLPIEIINIIFEKLPGNDRNRNYFINHVHFYPSEQTIKEIETSFFLYLCNMMSQVSNECRSEALRKDSLKTMVKSITDFAKFKNKESNKKKLRKRFRYVRALAKAIPTPKVATSLSDVRVCCLNNLHNTDVLNSQKIDKKIDKFFENMQWDMLYDSTQRAIGYTDFILLKRKIIAHFSDRIASYSENDDMITQYKAPLTCVSTGTLACAVAVLCKSALLALGGVLCIVTSAGFIICLNEDEDVTCKHHDKNKINHINDKLRLHAFQLKQLQMQMKKQK